MTNQSFALIKRHSFHAHAIEIIIGGVVFPDMVKAEGKILALPQPAHRRAELARFATAGMLAKRLLWARFLLEPGLDPDAVEKT